jgi:hypothetical protein
VSSPTTKAAPQNSSTSFYNCVQPNARPAFATAVGFLGGLCLSRAVPLGKIANKIPTRKARLSFR